jgi:cellulose synthase/poly-beta-1,6-N-acetylglucosamine synthase-like glycosyltransferase
MEWLLPVVAVLVLLACVAVLAVDHRVRKRAREVPRSSPGAWPRVSVIVPVTGTTQGMASCLMSVLLQDYPSHEVVFVTRGHDEEAVTLIRGLIQERGIRGYSPCRHVVSGDATACGQKNHNLLAGIASVSDEQGVFAFFDASHVAPSQWLKLLVGPIARNEAAVTTGFHHVLPGDSKVATLGRAVTVLILHRLREISRLTQPWGGSTAIKRSVFEELKVGELWATNVVDDVSLGVRLKRAGIKAKPLPCADIFTPLPSESLTGWSDWLTRQWLYLKFCFPGSWVMAGIMVHFFAALLLAASMWCFAALMGFASLGATLPALSLLLFVCVVGEALRAHHPNPGPRLRWLAALHATVFMGCFCHMRCWFAREIHWRRISYRVRWGGRVEEIREMES